MVGVATLASMKSLLGANGNIVIRSPRRREIVAPAQLRRRHVGGAASARTGRAPGRARRMSPADAAAVVASPRTLPTRLRPRRAGEAVQEHALDAVGVPVLAKAGRRGGLGLRQPTGQPVLRELAQAVDMVRRPRRGSGRAPSAPPAPCRPSSSSSARRWSANWCRARASNEQQQRESRGRRAAARSAASVARLLANHASGLPRLAAASGRRRRVRRRPAWSSRRSV